MSVTLTGDLMRRAGLLMLVFAIVSLSCSDVTGPHPFAAGEDASTGPPVDTTTGVGWSPYPRTVEEAVERLRVATQFETPQRGVGTTLPELVYAWRMVERSSDSRATYRLLYDSAVTVEGRLYALAGLFATDSASAARLASAPVWQVTDVRVLSGCIAATMSAEYVIRDFRNPEWLERYRPD